MPANLNAYMSTNYQVNILRNFSIYLQTCIQTLLTYLQLDVPTEPYIVVFDCLPAYLLAPQHLANLATSPAQTYKHLIYFRRYPTHLLAL